MTPLHAEAVERMARAICGVGDYPCICTRDSEPPRQAPACRIARLRSTAALAALRELLAERGMRVVGREPPAKVIDELYGPYLNPIASTARRKAWSDAIAAFPDPLGGTDA